MSKHAEAGDVYRLPYERAETETSSVEESLFEAAAEELEGESTPAPVDGPVSPESDDEEDEDDESEGIEPDDGSEEEEDSEDSEDESPDEEPRTFKVKVDGEEIEVTEDELLKGYSRTADYTRKTQAVAEKARAIEAEAEKTRAAREQYGQMVAELEQALTNLGGAEPDWDNLRRENPAEFAAQWAEHQQRQQHLAAVRAERQRVQQESMREYQAQMAQTLEAERARLLEAIPEWSDQTRAQKEKQAIAEYAQSIGFTEQQLSQITDHRLMVMLRKAHLYDQLNSKAKPAIAQKKKVAKVLQPGGKNPEAPRQSRRKSLERAEKRLAKTGRVQDAAALIYGMLGDDD